MKQSQERSNRAVMADMVLAYLMALPEPKEMPHEIRIEIHYKEEREQHRVALG